MITTELRLNHRKYHGQIETFRLEKYLGKKPTRPIEEIEETFGDLFSASTIESLIRSIEGGEAGQSQTERKSRQNLLQLARLGFIKRGTGEISAEIEKYRNSVRVRFGEETLTFEEVPARIMSETDPAVRREIFERSVGDLYGCADLVYERISQTNRLAKKLGFADLADLFSEITGLDLRALAKKCEDFLADSAEDYFRFLSAIKPDSPLGAEGSGFSEYYYLSHKIERKKIFPGNRLAFFYEHLLENFGFSSGKIPRIIFKRMEAEKSTRVFAPRIPEEVFLLVSRRDGAENYLDFLAGFGRAQKNVWTSPRMCRKYPEFVNGPDGVLGLAYGHFFQLLLIDRDFWQKSFFPRQNKPNPAYLRENIFRLFFHLRRAALRFLAELEFYSAGNRDVEGLEEKFSQKCTENLGFEFLKKQMAFELTTDFSAQKKLRAFLFACGLREYLLGRHDFHWWKKRAAFEELIDFWNTGERYGAEEMASLIGFELSFDLVAEIFAFRG